jgi:hypothetical protein
MAEYSRLASGQVISTGGNTAVIIPFVPNVIEIYNSTRATAVSGVTKANWTTDMGQGAAFYVTTGSGPADGTSFVSASTGGGFSTFQGGIALQYGPSLTISAMTKSSTIPQITTTANHNLVSGDIVVFQNLYQTTSTGQVQLCNVPFVVTYVNATEFTIAVNNNVSGYTALSSPVGGTVKQLLYPNLYAPGVAFIAGVNTSTNVITTTAPHNFVVGQEVAFRVPTAFGTTQLNTLPNILTPGSPNYYFVSAVGSSTTFTVSQSLSGYTAFTTNQTFASALAGGFNWPQVLAVGDANSGSLLTNFTSPSFYNGTSTSAVQTINGPALAGAFCNNTSQGFIIGGTISGTAADQIYWTAYMVDLSL